MSRLFKFLPGQFSKKSLNKIKVGDLIAVPNVSWKYYQVLFFELDDNKKGLSRKSNAEIYTGLEGNTKELFVFTRSEIREKYLIVTLASSTKSES